MPTTAAAYRDAALERMGDANELKRLGRLVAGRPEALRHDHGIAIRYGEGSVNIVLGFFRRRIASEGAGIGLDQDIGGASGLRRIPCGHEIDGRLAPGSP